MKIYLGQEVFIIQRTHAKGIKSIYEEYDPDANRIHNEEFNSFQRSSNTIRTIKIYKIEVNTAYIQIGRRQDCIEPYISLEMQLVTQLFCNEAF